MRKFWLILDLCWLGLMCWMLSLCLLMIDYWLRLLYDVLLLRWMRLKVALLLRLLYWRYHYLVVYLLSRWSKGFVVGRILRWWRKTSLAITHATAVSLDILVEDSGCVRILITVLIHCWQWICVTPQGWIGRVSLVQFKAVDGVLSS